MRCDVLAIGTELLLGQIVDTNSAWIGEQLAAAGIDTYDHRKVGDNVGRIVAALREQLIHADAVLCCGGLGPTQDDVTREAFAALAGVALERRDELVVEIRSVFERRGRVMTDSNLRQADVPVGAAPIPNPVGTAPGIRLELPGPDGRPRMLYAVPGVPSEMRQMVTEHVVPDLVARSGATAGDRVAVAQVLGDRRVDAVRDDRGPGRRADQPDDRLPRPRHRGDLRPVDGQSCDAGRRRSG